MPQTFSPLRYPGGKTSYAKLMEKIIELNKLGNCVFVEAFAGGAGAALSLLFKKRVSSLILNDLDFAIYSFWKSILNYTDEFIKLIHDTPISIYEWRKQKKIYFTEKEDTLKLGFATFFLNRTNRAGILAANPIGGITQKGNYSIDARFNKINLIKKIEDIAEKKASIIIYNQDVIDFINTLNIIHKNDNLFVYFDPPYFCKGKLLYLNHFDYKQHVSLHDSIDKFEHPWVLSYDSSPDIAEIYKDYPIYQKSLRYSITTPSSANELIISNLQMPSGLNSFRREAK